MTIAARLGLLVILGLSALLEVRADESPAAPTTAGLELFEKKIRPVLAEHCYSCHSAAAAGRGQLKGNLQLDTRQGTLAGGESGPAVVPGKPGESLLLSALRHDDLEMPPEGKLPAAVIADFEEWIKLGAPDPRAGAAAAVRKGLTLEEGRRFWSLVPPQPTPPPKVQRTAWPRDDIDRYVLAAQEVQKFEPAADASPEVLIRRLYFDLIGLPPAPEEIDQFQAAYSRNAQAAVEELVDRLLASPHFGERWGRHWLDLARYADSNGRDRNIYFYHAWRYRNFVIDAYNRDLPYDEFLRLQIAGDLLPASDEQQRDTQRIATGFLALGAKPFEEQKADVFRMDVVDEQIDLVGRAVLGLSIACARCHDHKFDAIPTADYYALAGIFRSTQSLHGYGPKGIKSNVHGHSELYAVGPEAESLGKSGIEYLAQLQALTLAQNTARSDRYREMRRLSSKKLEVNKPGADKEKLDTEIAALEAIISEWNVKVKAAEQALQAATGAEPPQPGWAMGARDRSPAEDCRIHIRGETTNLGDLVPRGVLQVVPVDATKATDSQSSGRRELAEWLVAKNNPLTARVMVNRIWLHLFGRGLVATPDDFGVNGSRPSHAELLDHLALRFMAPAEGYPGWSVKRLIRAIVLSSTYRQAAGASGRETDPDNIYLWQMSPGRLEAEIMRDAIGFVAGTLDLQPPGPGQEFLARLNPYREDEYRTFSPVFVPADIQGRSRAVYLPVVRGVLPELFQLFDFAPPERSVAQREESIVPAQSLYFMNNPWIIEQARSAARRLVDDADLASDAERVRLLYRRAYGRPPNAEETERAVQYLAVAESLQPQANAKSPPTADELHLERWVSFCQAVFASGPFRTVQ